MANVIDWYADSRVTDLVVVNEFDDRDLWESCEIPNYEDVSLDCDCADCEIEIEIES